MSDITISYKGADIATMDATGTKTLLTEGKYCEDDITIDYVKSGGGGGLSEVTLASTATKSDAVVLLILAGITIQSDHMYIMSIKNKNITDWISDQFIAGAYSSNGGKTGLRYRNGSAASFPISNSYDAKNEIGDTYVFADVLMWGT